MVTWVGDGGISGYNARSGMPTSVDDPDGGTVMYLLASNTMVDVEGVTRLHYPLNASLFNDNYTYLNEKYGIVWDADDRFADVSATFSFGPADTAEGAGRLYTASMVIVDADYFDGKKPTRGQMLDATSALWFRASQGYASTGDYNFKIYGPRIGTLAPSTKYWVLVFPSTVASMGSTPSKANDNRLGGPKKGRGLSMWTNRPALAPVITSPLDGATAPTGVTMNFSFTSGDPDRIVGSTSPSYTDVAGVQVQYAEQGTENWVDLPIAGDEMSGTSGLIRPGWYIFKDLPTQVEDLDTYHRGAYMLRLRLSMPLDCATVYPTDLAGQLPSGEWKLRVRTFDHGHPYGIWMNAFALNSNDADVVTPDTAPAANTSPWSEVVNVSVSERVPAPIPLSPVNDVAVAEDQPVTLTWLYRNTYVPPFLQTERTVQIRKHPDLPWTTLVSGNGSLPTFLVPEGTYPLDATGKYEWRVQVTDGGIPSVPIEPVPNVYPIVGWRSEGWRYKTHTDDNTADYSATAFDDSAWKIGLAPIGSEGLAEAHEELGWGKPRTTIAGANRVIWMRRNIANPGAGLDVYLNVRIDGGVKVWWNGAVVADPGEDWTLSNDRTIVIPAASVLADNVVAVRALDDEADPTGDYTVIDMAVDAVGVGEAQVPEMTVAVPGVTSAWSEPASFWVVPAPDSGPVRAISDTIDGATLGCGTHRVFVSRRGGKTRVGELTALSHVDWNRVRDDISDAKIVVSDWGVDCGDLLKKLQTWAYEIVIFRDNGFTVERVWEGPITLLTYERDAVTIHAKDVMAYSYRRIIKQAMNDSGNSTTAGDSVVARATKVLQNTFAPDDPNVLAYLRPIIGLDDAKQYRSLPPYSRTAFEEVDDMAANAGLDYTCSGRSILLWDTQTRIGTLPEFRDADLGAPPIVSEYGMSMANHYVVSDGNGVWGGAVRGGLALDEDGKVSGNDEDYGLIEMLSSTWASDSEEEEGTYTEAGLETVRASFRKYAERSIDDRYPPPVVVRVPDNTTLNPGTVLSIQQLVPGAIVPLRSTSTLRSVVANQKLDKVQVTEVSGSETISITLSPFSADDAEIVVEA